MELEPRLVVGCIGSEPKFGQAAANDNKRLAKSQIASCQALRGKVTVFVYDLGVWMIGGNEVEERWIQNSHG